MAALSDKLSAADQARAVAFVNQVLFLPWRAGARGPDAYDCWGLAQAALRTLAGIALPIVNADPRDLRAVARLVQEHPQRAEWFEVGEPAHLDLVTMSHPAHSHHIGVWLDLDGGVVLHAAQQFRRVRTGTGLETLSAPGKPAVSADSLPALKVQGWARIQFYRHGGAA
jgi:hypothetical protein